MDSVGRDDLIPRHTRGENPPRSRADSAKCVTSTGPRACWGRLTAPRSGFIFGFEKKSGQFSGGNEWKRCSGGGAMADPDRRFTEWLPAARNGSVRALGDAL